MCVEERLRGLGALGSWVVFTGEEKENGCVVGRLKFFFSFSVFFSLYFFPPLSTVGGESRKKPRSFLWRTETYDNGTRNSSDFLLYGEMCRLMSPSSRLRNGAIFN